MTKAKIKHKPYVSIAFMLGAALPYMRDVAYGKETQPHIHKTLDRSERMRNDEELLAKAEAKRLRKQALRLKTQKENKP